MKKVCFVFLVLYAAHSCAQDNKTNTPAKPYVTPLGTPFGNIVNAKMNSKGGKLISADKGLEVIIPASALDSEVNISIQSTHNELNENDEGAYQLEPSGLQFKRPVQLIFHYPDDNENADLKGIAWQDVTGLWRQLRNISIDTLQKTVSCLAPHFSHWAKFRTLYLKPRSATVKVNKTVALEIIIYAPPSGADDDNLLFPPAPISPDNDLLAPPASIDDDLLAAPRPLEPFYTSDWTVNGIVNGDGDVGSVAKSNNSRAIYTAPATLPDNNPVAVSVQIYSNNTTRKLLLTSHITVIPDKFHFTFIHIDENGCYFLVDSSSCILHMEEHNVTISDINNYPPWSDWPSSCDGCRWEWTNKESLKGLVEISGISSSRISIPNNRQSLPNVNITFTPSAGNTPSAKITCPRGSPITVPSKPYPASPQNISFDIDGKDVIIHAAGKTGRNELVIQGDKEKAIIYIYPLN
jgi:hypothetical protein